MALWVAAAVYFLGDISAHFNPAVTLAFAVGREIEWTIAAVYFVVQIAAAIFGSFLAWMFFGTAGNLARTDPQPGQDIQAMVFEIILTFGLVLLVLGMANGPKLNTRFIPLGAAAYIAAAATIGGPYEGASMNPARSIGPAIMTGHLENLGRTSPVPCSVVCSPSSSPRCFAVHITWHPCQRRGPTSIREG